MVPQCLRKALVLPLEKQPLNFELGARNISGGIKEVRKKTSCYTSLPGRSNQPSVTFKAYNFFVLTDSHDAGASLHSSIYLEKITLYEANHF